MTINGVVVLYKSDRQVIENIKSYQSFCNKLFVIDNSTSYNEEVINALKEFKNVEYLYLDEQFYSIGKKVGYINEVSSAHKMAIQRLIN